MTTSLAVLLVACATGMPAGPLLGFADCNPVLLRPLPAAPVTITISSIAYNSFGRVVGYTEEYSSDGRAAGRAAVTVSDDPGGSCPKMKYTVATPGGQVSSKTAAEFTTEGLAGYFGLGVKDIGGILVIGTLEGGLQTDLSYDSFGRRQLASQEFAFSGRRYQVTYSGVAFDGFGRLSGYEAVLKPAAAQQKQSPNPPLQPTGSAGG